MTERFSLDKIAIKHFKAVRQSGEVKLTPLTVFIGNNGSGKSSLIEGLETYSDIVVRGLDDAFERSLGVEHAWNKAVLHRHRPTKYRGYAYDNPISINIKGRWGRDLSLPSLRWPLEVKALKHESEGILPSFLRSPRPSRFHRSCRIFQRLKLEGYGESGTDRICIPQDWSNMCRRWQFLRLNPDTMGRPTSGASRVIPILERDGSNIGQYLLPFETLASTLLRALDALRFRRALRT